MNKISYKMSDNQLFSAYDDNILKAFVAAKKLNSLLNSKIEEYLMFAKNESGFEAKAEWLKKWSIAEKDEMLHKINQSLLDGKIGYYKLDVFQEVVVGYYEYFRIIDEELKTTDNFEEIFNTIIQIPMEICELLGSENRIYEAEVIGNIMYDGIELQNNRKKEKNDLFHLMCA